MPDAIFLDSSACECDVTLDTWLKDALSYLPGIDRGVAARELVLAAREFFDRTYAWKAVIPGVNAKAGDKQYWTSPYDQYANVIAVEGVAWKGTALAPLPKRPITLGQIDPPSSETPTAYYTLNPPDSFNLYPVLTVDTADAMDIYVALTPKQSVEHLPRIAALKYYDVILDGFLARTLRHPNKPYTDGNSARAYRSSFSTGCAKFLGQAKGGNLNAQNWRYPPGWRIR